MRPSLAASLALVLTVSLLPTAAAADPVDPAPGGVSPSPESASQASADGVTWTSETATKTRDGAAKPLQKMGEGVSEPRDEWWDNDLGLLTVDPEDVAAAEPTVVTELTELPEPAPHAEVYPVPDDGVYDVTGGGWGHRIGMSQYGAHGAGLAGLDHEEILDFYYPGTRLDTHDLGQIRIGITIDNDGVTRVDHRAGLQVSHGTSGTNYALPSREQWRVRATSGNASSCVLEGRSGGNWSSYQPPGMPTGCPVTFSSPSEGTVDLYLPSGERRVYRGSLTATHHGSSTLATVNRLPMQHYLRSVVPSEMPTSFHQEGLRTQAVAARTYAARGENGTSYYDTCDTTACQMYKGRGVRTSGGGITSYEFTQTTDAVNATDGQVLTYPFPGGRDLATTMYSSSTGGWTIPAGAGHPYLVAQEDPYDDTPSNARHRWNAQLPATALESRYDIHDVTRVQVTQRDGHGLWGGRILTARVEGYTAGGQYTYANATGLGLYLARPWPNWNTGLSTDYFTFGDPGETPPPGEVERIAGADRYGTAAALAEQWSPGVSVTYLVNGTDYPDALAAAARAGVYDAPVLLVQQDGIPSATRDALTRLQPGRLVIIGGPESVSDAVEQDLMAYTSGTMERVYGSDRYGTAAALAGYYAAGQQRVYLASGEDFPDALASAALAGKEHAPLLLTRQGQLDQPTRDQLDRLNPGQVIVLGGTSAVSGAVASEAGSYATNGFARVAGEDRYGTAAAIAERYPASTPSALAASGRDFPDALVGAALAGRDGAPVVLTTQSAVPRRTGDALDHIEPGSMAALGGRTVLADAVLDALAAYLR